jgi:hypothetical protein
MGRGRSALSWPSARSTFSPDRVAPVKEGRLAKRGLRIDLGAGRVTCPASYSAVIRTEPSGQRRAAFAKALCDACP